LAPVGLAPIYGKWDIASAGMLPWIGVVAWPLVLALIVRHREQIGALSLWRIAHFFVSLTPVLGLVPFGLQQHTFVADHFVYLAMIGAGLALGVWVERLAGQLSTSRGHAIASAAGLLLLGVYGVQSYRESLHWRNDETFWR